MIWPLSASWLPGYAVRMPQLAKIEIPPDVTWITSQLRQAGYEAYVVGGCVRDVLLGRTPKDWDVATNAIPSQIQQVFPRSLYENRFGTVGVHRGGQTYEVTTYRTEGGYSDARHPDEVAFVASLREDLARRDFTINAMALEPAPAGQPPAIIDPFGGQTDLAARLVKAVGDPAERLAEDALRLLRAVRFAVELGFTVEPTTFNAVNSHAGNLERVSAERIRDEFMKILASPDPYRGLGLLIETKLLDVFLPELLDGHNFDQPKHHRYPVLEHNLRSLKHLPSEDPLLRLAALLHDVGKPKSARGSGINRTFHGHEVIGARMVRQIMRRLKFSKADTERVTNLVRHHMFLFQFESTDKSIRRIVRRVGPENVDDLIALRVGDRLGSGCKIGYTKKLEQFKERSLEVQKDPIDTRLLAIDGSDIMRQLDISPGPVVGKILNQLLEDVLDDPARNTVEYLSRRAREIHQS